MTRFPASWVIARLGDLVEFSPKNDCADSTDVGFVPLHRLGVDYRSRHTFATRPWADVKKGYTHFADGDVLLARITPSFENGKAGIVRNLPNGVGAGSTEYFVCRPYQEALLPEYLLAHFKTPQFLRDGEQVMSGAVGQQRVPKQYVLDSRIPLPPLAEQKRIADKLDALLARVDACRERLDRVPIILKRFRQAVLSAATCGTLTEDWREDRVSSESGRQVVSRDANRKAALLARDPSLAKKKSTVESDLDGEYVFDVPKPWVFTTWGVVSEWITYGFTRPMPHADQGVPLLTARDIQNFSVELQHAVYTTHAAFAALSEKDRPKVGDMLLTKDGTIGRAALVRAEVPFCINQSVAVCWLRSTTMNKSYLELVANADFTQQFIGDKAKGMAIQHLSITDFAQCPLPVPPSLEQDEIVRRVESLFAYADRLEARCHAARTQVERLTPALLAKAFRGELVPQDPDDESASVLLERIRAARAAAPVKPKRGRATERNRQGEQTEVPVREVRPSLARIAKPDIGNADLSGDDKSENRQSRGALT